MAQATDMLVPTSGPLSPSDYAQQTNEIFAALASTHSGTSAPPSPTTWQMWLDTSGAVTARLLKMFDGTDWILLGTINATANTFVPEGLGGFLLYPLGGGNVVTALTNWNSYTGTGFLYGSGISNSPTGSSGDWLVVASSNGTVRFQLAIAASGTLAIWFRVYIGSWGSWKRIDLDAATVAEFRTGTDIAKFLNSKIFWDAGAYVALSQSSSIAPNLANGINFTLTLNQNITLANMTNLKEGQTGLIRIQNEAVSGLYQITAYGNQYVCADREFPEMPIGPGLVLGIVYHVLPSSKVLLIPLFDIGV